MTRAIPALLFGGVVLILGVCVGIVAATAPALTPTPAPSTAPVAPKTLVPEPIVSAAPAIPTFTATSPVVIPTPASTTLVQAKVPVPGPNEVWLWGGEYRPNKLTVPLGATVTWIGKDADPHDVENNKGLFFTTLPLGVTFNYTFTERGDFFYHCDCNTGMEGMITVE